MPRKITIVSRKYKYHEKFEYVCLSKERFFGYKKEGNIIIAQKEKAFIDSLLFPKYSGGIREISRMLQANIVHLDVDLLTKYALKVKSKMVPRRLGFLLQDVLSLKNKQRLLRHIGKGVGFLDPNMTQRKDLNKEWLLYTRIE